jgi:hypothetical protein
MHISQSQLRHLKNCPRQFQYRYLNRLGLPDSLSSAQHLGREFHRLMQQHFHGLDIHPLLEAQPTLREWFEQFQADLPPMIAGTAYTEHRRSTALEGFTLVGIYDLVIFGTDRAQILDWKTYPQPPPRNTLARHWQTRLYCYLLAATTDYSPEQISMTYWFAQGERGATVYTFHYTQAQHQQVENDLTQQLQQLQYWLNDYARGQDLPQVGLELSSKYCSPCPFQERCQRTPPLQDSTLAPFLAVLEDAIVPP